MATIKQFRILNEKYPESLKKEKWTDFFDSEEDIVKSLMNIKIFDESKIMCGMTPAYTGYIYIHSFAQRVQSGKELTKPQLTQAKRIAKQIRRAELFNLIVDWRI